MSGHATQHSTTALMGINLAAARKRKGMTQREVAVALDTNERMVTRWETGRHRPSAVYEQLLVALLFDGDLSALYAAPAENGQPEAA